MRLSGLGSWEPVVDERIGLRPCRFAGAVGAPNTGGTPAAPPGSPRRFDLPNMPPVYAEGVTPDDPHSWLEPDAHEAASEAEAPVSQSDHTHADHAEVDHATTAHDAARAQARLCARVTCGAVAEATLTADYPDRVMAVGPLSPLRTPPALDLCARHRDALTPPDGWELIAHDGTARNEPGQPRSTPPASPAADPAA